MNNTYKSIRIKENTYKKLIILKGILESALGVGSTLTFDDAVHLGAIYLVILFDTYQDLLGKKLIYTERNEKGHPILVRRASNEALEDIVTAFNDGYLKFLDEAKKLRFQITLRGRSM